MPDPGLQHTEEDCLEGEGSQTPEYKRSKYLRGDAQLIDLTSHG